MPYKHLLHFVFNKELSEIYITSIIRSFAFALIAVFIPAYLLKLGYPLNAVFSFYLYVAISYIIFVFLVIKIYTKIGLKHAMFISMPIFVVYFLLLYSLETYNWSLILVASVSSLATALYWSAFHIDFIRSSDRKHRGEELGMMNVFSYIAIIFAPLIGGLIISFLGFKVLFGFAALLLLIAPIPLFFTKDVYLPIKFSFRHVFHKESLKNFSVFFVEGIISYSETVIWAIFIFLILKSFLSLGLLTTLLVLFTTFMTFILGRLSDVVNKRSIMKIGVFSSSVIWFLKTMASSFLHFTILNSLFGIAFTFISLPYMALFYNKAAKQHPAEFVIFRELSLTLGRVMILLFVILSGSFIGSFIIAGFSSLVFILF